MERYDQYGYESIMVPTDDGDWVRHEDAEQAIATAILAERRRVWDIINEQVQYEIKRERSNGPYRLQTEVIKKLIFPNGEPQPSPTSE